MDRPEAQRGNTPGGDPAVPDVHGATAPAAKAAEGEGATEEAPIERAPAGVEGRPVGPTITVANEFAEVVVRRLETRNGSRLLIEVPRAGRSAALCPLELEALTRQTPAVFSAMMANPAGPLELDEP